LTFINKRCEIKVFFHFAGDGMDTKKRPDIILSIVKWLGTIFLLWTILSFLGIAGVFAFMFAVKDNPAYNLEMGWMAIILLVPVAAIFLSIVLTPILFKLFRLKRRGSIDT
jgi:hypothetical protein